MRLWPLRSFYLARSIAGGLFIPYLTLTLSKDGLSNGQIGTILAFGTLVAIVGQPLWGYVVDRFRVMRLTLLITALVPGLVAIGYDAKPFIVLMLVSALFNVFMAPQNPLSDSYAVASARKAGVSYGSIRIFGSMGWAMGSALGGMVLTRLDPSLIWLPFCLASLGAAGIVLTFPAETVQNPVRRGIFSELYPVLTNRRFLVFLIGGLLVSQTIAGFNSFFVLTFRGIGGAMPWAGTALMLASLSNVPGMLLATRAIRYLGPRRTMVLAGFGYLLRWSVMLVWPSPDVWVAVQILHGFSFGFYYLAAVDYVSNSFSDELQATGQSIFAMVTGSVATMTGTMLSGYLLDAGGPGLMYGISGLSAAGGLACFVYVAFPGRLRHRIVGMLQAVR